MTSRTPDEDREHLAQQPPDPGHDYSTFPAQTCAAGGDWYRNHALRSSSPDNGAWWFSSTPKAGSEIDKSGRFELPAPDGTCYLADSLQGAVYEGINPSWSENGWVAADDVANRVVSHLALPWDVNAADVSCGAAVAHRVTGELTSTTDYGLTQPWAQTLHAAGFNAVVYTSRFNPGSGRALALFGPSCPPPPPLASAPGDPSPQPVRPMVESWGIEVIDAPPDPSAVVIVPPPAP